jgi:hypothetical protein
MSDGPLPSDTDRFDYFMVRLHRIVSEPDRLSGQVERLGTGERWRFDTGEQLVRLVGGEPIDLIARDSVDGSGAVSSDPMGPSLDGGT